MITLINAQVSQVTLNTIFILLAQEKRSDLLSGNSQIVLFKD